MNCLCRFRIKIKYFGERGKSDGGNKCSCHSPGTAAGIDYPGWGEHPDLSYHGGSFGVRRTRQLWYWSISPGVNQYSSYINRLAVEEDIQPLPCRRAFPNELVRIDGAGRNGSFVLLCSEDLPGYYLETQPRLADM